MNGLYQDKSVGDILTETDLKEWLNSGRYNDFANINKIRVGNRVNLKLGGDTERTTFVVAGFNSIYLMGDNSSPSTRPSVRHAVLIPQTYIKNLNKEVNPEDVDHPNYTYWNSTATTGVSQNPNNPLYATTQGQEMSGYQGYYGSDMHQIYDVLVTNKITSVYGNDVLLSYQERITTDVDLEVNSANRPTMKGCSSKSLYRDISGVIAPCEIDMYGSTVFGSSGFDSSSTMQLPIFKFIRYCSLTRAGRWLRDVASKEQACLYSVGGIPLFDTVSNVDMYAPLVFMKL